ncbi:MAG: EAL domain-containing protein [Wenzhouxiangella sp.]|nr:EAL domain-containing protein [Wenzhouxiangella sp.]
MAKDATSKPDSVLRALPDECLPEFLDAAFDSLPGIFYLIDQQGRFRFWNGNMETVTGYSAEELAGMDVMNLFEPVMQERLSKALQQAFQTGRAVLEGDLLTRYGTTGPYSYYGRLVTLAGKPFLAGMGLDVSRLKQAQEAEAARAQQLKHLAGHVPGVIYQLRHDPGSDRMSMPYASAKLYEVFGVRHDEVAEDAGPLFARIFAEDSERVMRAVEVSARNLSTFRQQFRLCPAGGSAEHAEWVEVESTPERLADGATVWHGFARLVTERRRMEEELARLAYHDVLTGMPNRTQLQLLLEERIADASVLGNGLAVLHLDLDNFKDINDVWGHSTGDRLLLELADRLGACVGDEGQIGRIGGDEFLILVEGPEPLSQSERLASALCSVLATPVELDRRVVRVTGSIGVSLFPDDGETAEDLLRHADAALYKAKADGPGSWARYTPELTAAAMARRYMETELRAAIEREQIQVALQPIVALASGEVVGYEALARWHHRDDGWIDPEDFISLAESRGLVAPLGEQVYRKAMQHLAGLDGARLSINVAPAQLRQPDFCDQLVSLAAACGMSLDRLEVEVTERFLMEESHGALKQIRRLRSAGIAIAIDDFGTGYSSLSYLRKLPIQRLKIDQSFVRSVGRVRENAAIVKAILTLARELGLTVTAEGVQTAEESAFLQSAGCDHAQGWLFGRGIIIGPSD